MKGDKIAMLSQEGKVRGTSMKHLRQRPSSKTSYKVQFTRPSYDIEPLYIYSVAEAEDGEVGDTEVAETE